MINSEIITNKQNQERLLLIQYAARECFNLAEKVNYWIWIFCFISAILVFVPDSVPAIIKDGVPLLLDILAFIFSFRFISKLQSAAKLRNYFDSEVLELNRDSFTASDKQDLNQIALSISRINPQKATKSIHNTGSDIPPGVRNWYEFKAGVEGLASQYECQCQNVWWNKEMVKRKLIITPIIFITLLVFYILIFVLCKTNLLSVFVCSIGILIKIIERFIEHYRYHVISIQIETIRKHIETQLSTKNIEELQLLINQRRNIPVLEINFVHRKKAKTLSSTYKDIT